jgi:hypothetical protein
VNPEALAIAGVVAVISVIAFVTRETLRPSAPRYGRESDDWGDFANLPDDLCHFGTITADREENHAGR